MQGTAADLIKLAMIAVQGWLEATRLQSRLVLQVHDELVLEVPDAELMEIRTHLPRLMGHVATARGAAGRRGRRRSELGGGALNLAAISRSFSSQWVSKTDCNC